jgi:hypothetical protein
MFIANTHYVFGDLRTFDWITLILGTLQLLAAAGSWRATNPIRPGTLSTADQCEPGGGG